jgi:hypothetical protein
MRGTGTQQDPFLIDNLTDLNNVRNNLSAYYKVAAHIDATATQTWNSGAGFDPIDDFAGYFDGDFKNISGLYINRETDRNGLFGNIAEGATITKVILSNVNITGANHTGALVGYDVVSSTITKCCASGTVVGNGVNIGGLIGAAATGTVVISECFSLVNVTGSPTGTATGVLIGAFSGTGSVQNCYAKGSVNGVPSIGAFIGSSSNTTIKYCYSVGPVSGTSGSYSTGFCGYGFNLTTDSTNFFDKETTGKLSGFGATGKTTVQMHTIGTYGGWDFDVVWQWNPANYPTLRNVPESYLVVTPEIPIEDSHYTRISYNPVGTLIEDELHTDVGAESFNLNHDTFYAGTDLEIWTGEGQTGTQLVQDTDYTVGDEDTRLSTKTTKNVFTSITIINAAYQSGDLYFTYRVVGDYVDAADYNFIEETLNEPYVDKNNHIMGSIWPWVNKKNNYSATIPMDTGMADSNAICYDGSKIYVGGSNKILKYNRETEAVEDSVDVGFYPSDIITTDTDIFAAGKKIAKENLAPAVGSFLTKNAAVMTGNGSISQTNTAPESGYYVVASTKKSGNTFVREYQNEVFKASGESIVATITGTNGTVIADTNLFKRTYIVPNYHFYNTSYFNPSGWTVSAAGNSVLWGTPGGATGLRIYDTTPPLGNVQVSGGGSDLKRGTYTVSFVASVDYFDSGNSGCDGTINIRILVGGVEVVNEDFQDTRGSGYSYFYASKSYSVNVADGQSISVIVRSPWLPQSPEYVGQPYYGRNQQVIEFEVTSCQIYNNDWQKLDDLQINNLFTNPDFSNGSTGWSLGANTAVQATSLAYAKESLAYDGQYIYQGTPFTTTVNKVSPADISSSNITLTSGTVDMVYADGYIWRITDTYVYKLAPNTLSVVASYNDAKMTKYKNKLLLVIDGTVYVFLNDMWVVILNESLTRLTDIGLPVYFPTSVTADQEHIYVVGRNGILKFARVNRADLQYNYRGLTADTNANKACFDGNVVYVAYGNGSTTFKAYGINKIGGN